MIKIIDGTAKIKHLAERMKSGLSTSEYGSLSWDPPQDTFTDSRIEAAGEPPLLDPSSSSDADNAILVYEYLKGLSAKHGIDPQLWVALTHRDFRSYAMSRWSFADKDGEEADKKVARYKDFIMEHWFCGSKWMSRNSIARLWWAAHLTVAPWERNPELFSEIKNDDRYYYTKLLFKNQDIHKSLVERFLASSEPIRFGVLYYLSQNPDGKFGNKESQYVLKNLNMMCAYKKPDALSVTDVARLIDELLQSRKETPGSVNIEVEAE